MIQVDMPHVIYHESLDENGTDWDTTIYGPFPTLDEAKAFALFNLSDSHANSEYYPLVSPKTLDPDSVLG